MYILKGDIKMSPFCFLPTLFCDEGMNNRHALECGFAVVRLSFVDSILSIGPRNTVYYAYGQRWLSRGEVFFCLLIAFRHRTRKYGFSKSRLLYCNSVSFPYS
jgi:hypothetical protein